MWLAWTRIWWVRPVMGLASTSVAPSNRSSTRNSVIARLPSGMRIIRYDKRGHGLSDLPRYPEWGMGDHVADLAGLLDALGVKAAMAWVRDWVSEKMASATEKLYVDY